MRQNTRSLRAENYARILDRMSTVRAQIATDGDLDRIVGAVASEYRSGARLGADEDMTLKPH